MIGQNLRKPQKFLSLKNSSYTVARPFSITSFVTATSLIRARTAYMFIIAC